MLEISEELQFWMYIQVSSQPVRVAVADVADLDVVIKLMILFKRFKFKMLQTPMPRYRYINI